MRLIIAEKPAQAKDYANALGATTRRNGYFEGAHDLVTYCVGHLIELLPPEGYDPRLEKWRREDLPILPPEFRYRLIAQTAPQYEVIAKLLERADITEVVNACDADRAGELIFNLVYNRAKGRAPVSRLWISSLTTEAIRAGFSKLQPAANYRGLLEAGYAQLLADWMIGMNGTRAQTIVAREQGSSRMFSLGRVQTPVLALVVARDNAIDNFKPSNYFRLSAEFTTPDKAPYTGWWLSATSDRFETSEEADKTLARLRAHTSAVIARVESKSVNHAPPLLFDLTELQRVMDRAHGFSASHTLELAQSLYEERKALTYPRTDSGYLTTDLAAQISKHLQPLEKTAYEPILRTIIERGYVLTKTHVSDAKAAKHHAIIPTAHNVEAAKFSPDERRLYDVVVRRFLAAFYPAAVDALTQITTRVGDEYFITRGTVEVVRGWREIDAPIEEKEDDAAALPEDERGTGNAKLPAVTESMAVCVSDLQRIARATKAPARYTASMLLGVMEKYGLGTSATRAPMIEKLLDPKRPYMQREKRKMISLPAAREVIARLGANPLAKPEMTGAWEAKLAQIERGTYSMQSFVAEAQQFTRQLVLEILAQPNNQVFAKSDAVMPCPLCEASGRDGFLRIRNGTDQSKFLACSLPNEVCRFTSAMPRNAAHAKALATKKCPTCKSAMRLRSMKADDSVFLSCVAYPACKGVIWLDAEATRRSAERAKKKESKKA